MKKKSRPNLLNDKTSLTLQNASGSFFVGYNQQGINKKFGSAIRKKRIELGYSQEKLAEVAGLNRSFLSELERGITTISIERADKLCHVLGTTLADMLS